MLLFIWLYILSETCCM